MNYYFQIIITSTIIFFIFVKILLLLCIYFPDPVLSMLER